MRMDGWILIRGIFSRKGKLLLAVKMWITGRMKQMLRAWQFGNLPPIGTVMPCSEKNMRKYKKVVDKKK